MALLDSNDKICRGPRNTFAKSRAVCPSKNLRFTSFGTNIISPFEIVTGCPMHLTPASFDPQLVKGEILQYCKGLIASIINNHNWVEQSFHSVGDEDLKHHTLQL